MKRNEIQSCAMCGKGVVHTGIPLFWTITIARFGIDANAVRRRQGLEMFFGGGNAGAALAGAMGLDEDIAVPVMDEKRLAICEECAMKEYPLAAMAELEPLKV
jgi:hypothetical protein